MITNESEKLREAIRKDWITPKPGRDQEKPDYSCPWENAVRRIYAL